MMMHESAPLYAQAPLPALGPETLSISLGVGNNRSSSIALPHRYGLVKHSKNFIPAPTPQQLQSLLFAHQQEINESAATSYGAVRAPSLLPYQQIQKPIPPMNQDHFAPTSDITSLATNVPQSRLNHSDRSTTNSVRIHSYQQHARDACAAHKRRRRSVASASNSKRCLVVHCDKISVSRGLCRGHGGGRRCQHTHCTKGAQSRSDYCWAHGGGQRCEIKSCMRSRKSKRFCVAHLSWETTTLTRPVIEAIPARMQVLMPMGLNSGSLVSSPALTDSPRLPSLLQALRNTQSSVAIRS